MASLIVNQGKLVYNDPAKGGVITQQPLLRNWRPNKDWSCTHSEFIEPLGAIGARANITWGSMAGWTTHTTTSNPCVRPVNGPGFPVTAWAEMYDGTAYPAGTVSSIWRAHISKAGIPPAFLLGIKRSSPPAGQGVVPQVGVMLSCTLRVSQVGEVKKLDPNGEWEAGYLSLVIPLGSKQFPKAALHVSTDIAEDIATSGEIIAESPWETAGDDKDGAEGWIFETVMDAVHFEGTHFLIRRTGESDWWHVYHPCVQTVPTSTANINWGGMVSSVNLTPLTYSGATAGEYVCTCSPPQEATLPGGTWNPTVSWGRLATVPAGWTVVGSGTYGESRAGRCLPLWTMTPAAANMHTRPILWLGWEAHKAVLTEPATLQAEDSTDGDKSLVSIDLTLTSDWKGATGSAEFNVTGSEIYPLWRPQGQLDVYFGWQTGAGTGLASQKMMQGYILPDGLPRGRDGANYNGAPWVSLKFGDLFAARAEPNCLVDMWQAGGLTVTDWMNGIANALGIAEADVYIDPAIATMLIPCDAIPSRPNLEAQDGEQYLAHIRAVEDACNISVGTDVLARLFADLGKPLWTPGVSLADFTLDYNLTSPENVIRSITVEPDGGNYRNMAKGSWGSTKDRKTKYWASDTAQLHADGGPRWGYVEDGSGTVGEATIVKRWQKEYTSETWLSWEGPLRPGIQPDKFIVVAECPDVGLTMGDVYQVEEVTYHASSKVEDSKMSLRAKRVYKAGTPSAAIAAVGGAPVGVVPVGSNLVTGS